MPRCLHRTGSDSKCVHTAMDGFDVCVFHKKRNKTNPEAMHVNMKQHQSEQAKKQILPALDELTNMISGLMLTVNKRTGITDASIVKKAKELYFQDFTIKEKDKINQLTEIAMQIGFIKPGKKLPTINIKQHSDIMFDKLEDNIKRMYIESAETFYKNRLGIGAI